ncbi:MAG TPA: membrane protein insertion efficiency factor YidD [Vicinamibacterales bacterium]|nr:membrane protein insertion efficiency factor YidD [Vicinamibacterales bacterium]
MKKRLGAAIAIILVAIALDLRRAPAAQLVTRSALGVVHVYQATLSPLYTRLGLQCRFTPTCSHYGEAVIRKFGAMRGGWMATKRIFRCGPWTPIGTVDPPPV